MGRTVNSYLDRAMVRIKRSNSCEALGILFATKTILIDTSYYFVKEDSVLRVMLI